jgi:tRNA (cytidine/uridine-2'-O-)-methyltransferase
MPTLALYQPDIPQNTGNIMRTCACFGVPLVLLEPLGFVLDDKKVKRSLMDYADHVQYQRQTWEAFRETLSNRRLVLATTRGAVPYYDLGYKDNDVLLFGSESAGVPEHVHQAAHARIVIPMENGMRSLNLAVSVGIVLARAREAIFSENNG